MYEYLCDFEGFLPIYMLNSPSIFISRDQDGGRIFANVRHQYPDFPS